MPKAKATTKKTATTPKKTTVSRKKQTKSAPVMQRALTNPSASSAPFMQTRMTMQSVYWMIFGVVAIAFAIWIYTLDARIREIYDTVDTNSYSIEEMNIDKAMLEKQDHTDVDEQAN